ncbi:hypothetical protein [Candidatus Chlorohelix sp.]|uniref:hypothetical protein n=1 Tax=Candidatus Chlorohelix sp. TaxID=3139201 RepID=UPI00302AFD58
MLRIELFSIVLAGEPLATTQEGNTATVLRMALFMLALLMFMLLAGLAWRTLPFLRKIIPTPQEVEERERLAAEQAAAAAAARPKRSINLTQLEPLQVKPTIAEPNAEDTALVETGAVINAANDLSGDNPPQS